MDVTAIGGYCPDAYTADSGLLFLAPDGVGVDKTENAPLDATWGLIQKMGVGSIYTMMALDSDARAWINGYNGLVWAGWQKIATATPPQKYTLPLADGWVRVNAAEYWKTQEGIVIVPFRVARENGAEINTSTQIIATLPEGFRPPSDVTPHIAVSTMVVGSGGDRDAVAWVNSSGNIYAQASSSIPAKDGGTPVNWGGFAGTFVFSSGS